MDIANELGELLRSAALEMGTDLQFNAIDVTAYAAERTAFLSTLIDQPGFQEAVIAERDNIALRAGMNMVSTADAADARILGIIQGVLGIGARALTLG